MLTEENQESFYRAIKRSQPEVIDDSTGKITSALFKDPCGVSMDKRGGRDENDVCTTLEKHFGVRFKGAVKLLLCDINEVKAYICPEPSKDNIYHIALYKDKKLNEINSMQALMLADFCKLVMLNKKPDWVKK